jgi:hypothetical protein
MKLISTISILLFLCSCSSEPGERIISKASIVTGRQLDSIRLRFKPVALSCSTSIRVLKKADTSSYDLVSSVDTNLNILQIALTGQNSTASTQIAVTNSVGNYSYAGQLGDTILCLETPELWIIAWFDEPFFKTQIAGDLNKNHRIDLHIRAIEKSSGKKIADEIVYTKDCCVNNLDMKYNANTESVLYAFNDFGGRDYKIIYGQISVHKNKMNFQKPIPLIFKDESEKRQPTFVNNGKNNYLFHTTGDSWGLMGGHFGKEQIGIFQVDRLNKLINHKIINDTSGLDEKIVFIGDTIFYRLKDNTEYDKMTIKKIAWEDLKEN